MEGNQEEDGARPARGEGTQPDWRERIRRWSIGKKIGGAITVAAGVATIIVCIIQISDRSRETASPRPSDPPLTINKDAGFVEGCYLATGKATLQEGKQIWLMFREETDDRYYLRQPKVEGGDWKAQLTLGGPGEASSKFSISVFYLPDDLGNFLKGVAARIPNPENPLVGVDDPWRWTSSGPPPDRSDLVEESVTRSGDTADCP